MLYIHFLIDVYTDIVLVVYSVISFDFLKVDCCYCAIHSRRV